jgi:predicted MFS family arabinose efflux permease
MVHAMGWRVSFLVLASINGLFILCISLFVQDYPTSHTKRGNNSIDNTESFKASVSLKMLFSNWNYWAISLSIFLRYGPFAAVQALWIGPFLIQYLGMTPVSAGNLMLMISIGFILGSPIGGFLSDRVLKSRRYALMIALTLAALCIFLLSRWRHDDFTAILGGILFFFGFFNAFGQISYAHIRELMPDAMAGTAMTGINFFMMMGAGLFIHALGGVMAHMTTGGQAYHVSFLICAISLLMAFVLYTTTEDCPIAQRAGNR